MKKLYLLLILTVACSSMVLIPRKQELKMGEDAYRDMLKKERLSSNQLWNEMLQRVGKRISDVANIPDFKWEFKLIENEQMNAFCLPGGKVAFYTGILPVLENEAGMAVVMGHEVAHAVARHGVKRVSQAMVAQFGLSVFDAAMLKESKYRNVILGGLGLGAQIGVILPFSRANETEADSMGIRYSAMAGYDPEEGIRFWQRFAKATEKGGKPPSFLSTHPSSDSRINNMRSLQKDVQPLYEQSPKYGLGKKI